MAASSSLSIAASASTTNNTSSFHLSNKTLIPIFSTLHFSNPKQPPLHLHHRHHHHHHLCRATATATATFDDFTDDEFTVDESEPESETELETESESEEGEEEEQQQQEEIVSGRGEMGRLYVGNLPYSMTSSQLAAIFGEAGRVVSAEVVYDRVTDRSRGFAFVTMTSSEEAKEAIKMFDGSQVGGRSVKVNFPEVPRGGEREVMGSKIRSSNRAFVDSPHKLYVGNLSWNITSDGLRDTFSEQPGLLGAKVIYQRDTGKSRGFGFVTFASMEEAESALKTLDGVELEGRPLRLNVAAERSRENTLGSSAMLSGIRA